MSRESLMETEATLALPIRGGGGEDVHLRRGHVNFTNNDIQGFGVVRRSLDIGG